MRAALIAFVPACFGGGPVPSAPSEAQVVFALPPQQGADGGGCSGQAPYIGTVAIGATNGFVMTLPYEGPGCNNGQMIPMQNVPVISFPKDGSMPTGLMVTPNGVGPQSNATTRPRIAADVDTEFWAIVDSGSNVVLGGGATQPLSEFPAVDTAALVVDADAIYLGMWLTQNGHADPDGPPWPGDSQNVFGLAPSLSDVPHYSLIEIARSDGTVTSLGAPAMFCEVMKDCVVQNTDSLFVMSRGMDSHLAVISQIDKATGTSTDVDTIESDLAGNVGPVGLAADAAHVVWTASVDPQLGTGCFVFAHALGGATSMLLATDKFSCSDAAFDGAAVYFAIVSVDDSMALHGDGIGRVALDGTFTSVRVGVSTDASGPRRLYLDGTDLYAVDPLVIAKIPTAAITGQDF